MNTPFVIEFGTAERGTITTFQVGKDLSTQRYRSIVIVFRLQCEGAIGNGKDKSELDLTVVDRTVERIGRGPEAVIPILQALQD